MKVKAYIRVALSTGHKGYRVDASSRPNYKPLVSQRYPHDVSLPTVAFAVTFDIPTESFKQAEQVLAEIGVPAERIEIAAEVDEQ